MKKLPKEIFVTLEEQGTENEYLAANANLKDCASDQIGDQKQVGRYILKEIHTIQTVVETKLVQR